MSAFGAVELTSDPVAALIAQVNRFGPSAPSTFRYIGATYPLATGKVPYDVALSATFIVHRRAQDAVIQFGDAASRTLLTRASAGMKDPVGYITSNLGEATQVIKTYGDSVGLPAAGGFDKLKIFGVPASTLAIGAGGLVALAYIFLGRKR